MAATDFTSVSLTKEFADEIRADAEQLAKAQGRLRAPSLAEMIAIAYRFYKQRKDLKGPDE